MKNRQTEAFPHAASQLTFFLSRELKDRTAVKGTRVAAAAGSAGWVERTSVVTVRIMMKDFFGHPEEEVELMTVYREVVSKSSFAFSQFFRIIF